MKPRFVITAALVTLLAASTTPAQDSRKGSERDSSHEDLGDRIGSIVEDVIERISRHLRLSDTDDSYFEIEQEKRPKRPGMRVDEEEGRQVYEGDVIIHEGDTVAANIVVKAGDLTVYGVVDGDAMVVGGNLYVKEGGSVTGNAKVINGDIVQDEGGKIGGYIDRTSSTTVSYREDERKFRRSATRLNANWVSETTNLDNFIFRYNRVEGIFIGLGSEKRYYWDGQKDYSVHGSVGWGFKSHRWRYNLGLARQFAFGDGQLFELGAEGHSFTDTKDHWIIGVHENTAAALLIHEDYRDYFGREGFGLHAGYALQQNDLTAQLKLEYLLDRYRSLSNRTEWAIFGGDKVFRINPPIDEGKMRSILASAGLSTVTKTYRGPEGWSIFTTAEFAEKNFGSDFSFSQYLVDIRRYQPLGRYDNFNVRLRAGTSEGVLPVQKTFEIGGLSTLNAFPFKSEAGNRLILVNAEYIINADFLGDLTFWPSSLMRGINFLVLADAGLVRNVPTDASWLDGFGGIAFSEFKHDVGFGIASRSGAFRLAFVWRTDRDEPARFIFRFARPF